MTSVHQNPTVQDKLSDFVQYTRARSGRYLSISILTQVLSKLFLLLSIVMTVGLFWKVGNGTLGEVNLRAFFFTFIVVNGASIRLRRLSKSYGVNGPKLLSQVSQSPILYLRSFRDEINEYEPHPDKENSDELIAEALRGVAPLISIGRSSDKRPPLGAIRLYFDNEEWQEKVEHLMTFSQLVIIQPGYSEGVEWEMITAQKTVHPQRVLFSFLSWYYLDADFRQREYEVFRMQVKRSMDIVLPGKFSNAYFLCFDDDWVPHFASPTGLRKYFFKLSSIPHALWRLLNVGPRLLEKYVWPIPGLFRGFSIPSIRETLRPMLKKQGINVPIIRSALHILSVISVVCVMLFANVLIAKINSIERASAYASTKVPEGSYRKERFILSGSDPKSADGVVALPSFFDALKLAKISPGLGRTLFLDENKVSSNEVMISYRMWKKEFNSDISTIGTDINLDGKHFIIVGIMPKDFNFPTGSDVWTLEKEKK